ncbi:MAG: HipA domain-containing protein [Rothia sp. (in: high G+C Gram-positive bacteria)]|nr:HipA domain-containing protein [Rothia sp. (in: high G+C Gram-positive bacteria)]
MTHEELKKIATADVYLAGQIVGRLARTIEGGVEFSYLPTYKGPEITRTLPLGKVSAGRGVGALPPFFAGLLPEGYRLTLLQKSTKTSLDDELTLLLAVGQDVPGNVQVVPAGQALSEVRAALRGSPQELRFDSVFAAVDEQSLPGVQAKASAQMMTSSVVFDNKPAILKVNPQNYPLLVRNEYEHLLSAAALGVPVVSAEILKDAVGEEGLLVQRFDRECTGEKIGRLAVEDATQLMGLYPAQKYSVASEDLVEAVSGAVSSPLIAVRNLYLQFLFAWLTGNGDLHAKNISVLTTSKGHRGVAPVYDLPCTLIYGDDTMALELNGKVKKLKKKDWDDFAATIGLPAKAARSAQVLALRAAQQVDLSAIGFSGSTLRGTERELRFRRYELEG